MRILAIGLVLGASTAATAAPLTDCPTTEPIGLTAKTAATLRTTYELARTDLRVCIDKAVYPYASGRGHRLLACFTVASGGRSTRVCGDGNSYFDWRGYRITVSMRTPRFTESSDVWLQIDRTPARTI
jgi:hypothetical protein